MKTRIDKMLTYGQIWPYLENNYGTFAGITFNNFPYPGLYLHFKSAKNTDPEIRIFVCVMDPCNRTKLAHEIYERVNELHTFSFACRIAGIGKFAEKYTNQ
jgi:hypothetical protein